MKLFYNWLNHKYNFLYNVQYYNFCINILIEHLYRALFFTTSLATTNIQFHKTSYILLDTERYSWVLKEISYILLDTEILLLSFERDLILKFLSKYTNNQLVREHDCLGAETKKTYKLPLIYYWPHTKDFLYYFIRYWMISLFLFFLFFLLREITSVLLNCYKYNFP